MCEIVHRKSAVQRFVTGRSPKLEVEDQVLLTLEYWRECRTMFHLATSWDIPESAVSRIIARLEDILSGAAEFKLPGKRFAALPSNIKLLLQEV
jgi:hypothetical protein